MLKKRIYLSLILVTISTVSMAQKGFRVGPSAMFLSSRTSVIDSLPNSFNFRFKSGFGLGLSLQYGVTPNFTIASGANFVSKGYRVYNDTNRNGDLLKHNINHLEVPLNFIFNLKTNSSSLIRGVLGVTHTSILSQQSKVLENGDRSFIIKQRVTHTSYPMLNLGVEISKENKINNLFVFGVYFKQSFQSYTILDIYNNANSSEPRFNLGYKGTYIGVGVSYLFNLKNLKKSEEFFY